MKPMDRAVYWVEYVLRHNGASHLRSNSITLNNIQYFLVDVCFIFIIITGLVLLLAMVIKYIVIVKKNKPVKNK